MRKMPTFALLVTTESAGGEGVDRAVISENLDVLRTLGHSEPEARKLLVQLGAPDEQLPPTGPSDS